jgi:hypothetical protein
MFGGGGIAEHEASAVSGGGGTAEQVASAVTGGGGIAEHDGSLISGGGGTAEQVASAVAGGGGIAEHDGSAVFGGGGMADPDNEVRGGGGMAEQASVVLGGGGINDPERAWLSALARTNCPASMIASPSSSPACDHAPDSTLPIMRLICPSVNPPSHPSHRKTMIMGTFGRHAVVTAHDSPPAFHDHVQKPVLFAQNCSRS